MDALNRILPGLAATGDPHPLLVHFPIAFFPAALLLALLSLGRNPELFRTARLCFFLGLAGLAAAILSGYRAAGRVPPELGSELASHRNLMLVAAAVAAILALPGVQGKGVPSHRRRQGFVAGLILLNVLLVLGADRGGLVREALPRGPASESGGAGSRGNPPSSEKPGGREIPANREIPDGRVGAGGAAPLPGSAFPAAMRPARDSSGTREGR